MNRVSWSCTAGKRNSTGNSIVDPFTASGGWVVSRHLGGGPGFPRADGRGPQAEDSFLNDNISVFVLFLVVVVVPTLCKSHPGKKAMRWPGAS